jgi:hemolysin activation/secretion protein
MAGGIDGVNSDNASFGQVISSDRTRALRGALSGSGAAGKTSWSASGSISQGLNAFGARVNEFLATPQFTKVNLQAAVSRPIGKAWRIDAAAAGQATRDALPAAELITFGGARFGRAFGNDALAGDSGLGGSLKGSELYGFVDGGTVWINERAGGLLDGTEADLASAGGGVRFRVGKRMMLGVEAANTVDTIRPGDEDKWRVGFSLQSAF